MSSPSRLQWERPAREDAEKPGTGCTSCTAPWCPAISRKRVKSIKQNLPSVLPLSHNDGHCLHVMPTSCRQLSLNSLPYIHTAPLQLPRNCASGEGTMGKHPASPHTDTPKAAAVGLARWEKLTTDSSSQLQTAEPDTNCNLKLYLSFVLHLFSNNSLRWKTILKIHSLA